LSSCGFNSPRIHLTIYGRRLKAMTDDAPPRVEGSSRLPMPPPGGSATMSLGEAILMRTSASAFEPLPLPVESLATVLYLGNGIRRKSRPAPQAPRNAPSAGNLGSVEIFPIVLDVEGVEAGLYYYDHLHHELVALRTGSFRQWLAAMVLA